VEFYLLVAQSRFTLLLEWSRHIVQSENWPRNAKTPPKRGFGNSMRAGLDAEIGELVLELRQAATAIEQR
jgi:hypothetical protein